jgi:hypothetical protein
MSSNTDSNSTDIANFIDNNDTDDENGLINFDNF